MDKSIIPLFPLSGVIFFPETNLPLNIFEQRYLEMIDFALKSNRLIGMIQNDKNNKLYSIGCVGKLNSFSETDDGRYVINLIGKNYFRISKKLPKTYKFITAEIDIIYNQGIDFDKGCFIGQEVIARVKYKGSIKKKYISFKINSSEIIDNANINDINKKIVGSLIYNSKINNDIFGFGLTKIEYIKKPLELFCKDVRLSMLN